MKKVLSVILAVLMLTSLAAAASAETAYGATTGSTFRFGWSRTVPAVGENILTVTQEGKPVAGVTFELYRVSQFKPSEFFGENDTLVGTYTTDEKGTLTASHLTPGLYYWRDEMWVVKSEFRVTGLKGSGIVRSYIDLPTSVELTVTTEEETYGVAGQVTVSADLSGGYLGEINGYGTIFLYSILPDQGEVLSAIGFTLTAEEYEEEIEYYSEYETYKEEDGVISVYEPGEYGFTEYLTKLADGVYYELVVENGVGDPDAVFGRVKVTAAGFPEAVPEPVVGMANPWTDTEDVNKAADGAEVGYFMVPENGTEVTGGRIDWYGFRFMTHLAEADGAVGAAELTVRKGLKQESEDVSGDYTEYAYTWTQEADGWDVTCYGNEEGRMMKAVWLSDNFSYSITVRGQGDLYDTYGLGAEDVVALVTAIQ